ncbi:unnamed protein product [Penicillium pancosmium]
MVPAQEVFGETTWLGNPPRALTRGKITPFEMLEKRELDCNAIYPKDNMQEISKKLRNGVKRGDEVTSKDMTGQGVKFKIRTGEEVSTNDVTTDRPGKLFLGEPFIRYHTMDELKATALENTNESFKLSPPFCSMDIGHVAEERDPKTRQLIAKRAKYKSAHEKWLASGIDHRVRIVLQNITCGKVNKVIALGLNSISSPILFDDLDHNTVHERTLNQHLLFLTICDYLRNRRVKSGGKSTDIACFAQDPAYTKVDKQFLNLHQVKVLKDPEAWIEVDESSMVIAINPGVPARQIVMDVAQPMVMFWMTLQTALECDTDPDSDRLRVLLRSFYSEMDLMHPMFVSATDRANYSDLTDLSVFVRDWGCV